MGLGDPFLVVVKGYSQKNENIICEILYDIMKYGIKEPSCIFYTVLRCLWSYCFSIKQV